MLIGTSPGTLTILSNIVGSAAGGTGGVGGVGTGGNNANTNNPTAIALTGEGVRQPLPNIVASATNLTFGNQAIGSISAIQSIIVRNDGFANLTLGAITVSGVGGVGGAGNSNGFKRSDTAATGITELACAASLAPQSSCHISITFAPTVEGMQSGEITIVHNVTSVSNPLRLSLNGIGTPRPEPRISLSPARITFTDQVINTISTAQRLIIANTGTAALVMSAITVVHSAAVGNSVNDYAVSGSCSSTLNAGASCILDVAFSPSTVGDKSATLIITSNAANAVNGQSGVSLTGTAIPVPRPIAKLSVTTLGFGNVIVGGATPTQPVLLTNTGNLTLNITSITAVGNFIVANGCGASLATNASCTVTVAFNPLGLGALNGALRVVSDAASSPDAVQLSGTGCRWLSPSAQRFFITACGR